MAVEDVPGIPDGPRLTRWISENGVASGEPTAIKLIAGGRSNLTYRLDVGPSRLVLRRPPLGHVLPTAHDMTREFRVLTALHGTDIPVPAPVAICDDPDVIGAPFYLMEYVDGLVLRTKQDAEFLTPDQARQLSQRLAEMLAAIHQVDIARAGLTGFGRPEGYLARQLARWQRQWELSKTREMPGYDRLVERLVAGLPEDGDHALVHGDFRLDNTLVTLGQRDGHDDPGLPEPQGPRGPQDARDTQGAQPAVAAVVDWEMSTLGDPLADLGLTLIYWADPADPQWLDISIGAAVTAMPGFFTRAELAARYAELTGRDLSGIGYYMAFGCFKLAVVLEGIHARFLQHQTVGEGFEREGLAVPVLIDRAHQMLDSVASGGIG
jgi:aminoglycoside phosphotransferase (APT) family kinase protein